MYYSSTIQELFAYMNRFRALLRGCPHGLAQIGDSLGHSSVYEVVRLAKKARHLVSFPFLSRS